MSNQIILKKSSVGAKVPLTTDLAYGELALNYADGKLYFKNSSNAITSFGSNSATETLTNKTLTSPTINGGALSGTFSGAITLSDTTAATSTTTGALKIGGGLGVAGAIYADQIRLTNNGAGTNVYIGDDVVLGDVNQANTLGIRGLQDSAQGYIVFGNANNTNYIGRSGSNPLQVTGQFKVDSGTVTGASAVAMQIAGYANKGGTGYHDFLSITNSYATATNPTKWFRLNSTGNLEIINSAYTTNIFTLTDAGTLSVPAISAGGTTGTSGQFLQSTGSGLQWASPPGSGTVTSITASTGLTGGTITSSGTIAIDTSVVATLTGTQTLTNKTISGTSNTLTNIPNSALTNSSLTINGTSISLGGSGSITTSAITEGTNLYYTDARARAAHSAGNGISYNSTTGVISLSQAVDSSSSPTFASLTTTGNASVGGDLTVTGNLTVNGTTTTVNSTTISVDDKNLELGSIASPTNITADGGGITLKGTTDKTFNWVSATSAWTSSEHLALAAGKTLILNGSTSGTVTVQVPAAAGSTTITLPATTGNVVTTGDTGTVTNGMLAGSIATSKITGLAASATTDTTNASNITSGTLPNARLSAIPNTALANSSVTINGSAVSLGGSATITANTTNVLTIGAGLTGTSFNGSSAVTIAIDSTVATLTGVQTLTNKTLTSPTINGGALSGSFSGVVTFSDTTASTTTATGAVKVAGGVGVAGNIYTGGRVGFVNASNVSAVYQFYNTATGTLDTVFA